MPPSNARLAWFPWLLLAAGAGGVLYGMVGFWLRGYESFDRAIILFASAWLVWQNYAKLIALPDTPKPALGSALLAFGTIAFLPPWFVFSQIGSRPVILWWEALALFVAAVGLILVRSGPNLLKSVRFSLIFPLFALPLPGRIQNPLQELLQGIAASIAAEVIPLFGVPVLEKMGNSLRLPSGGINVVEACSGLTQVRAILSVAAFIARMRGFGAGRGLVTVGLAIPIIVFINSLRVTFSALIQEWWGHEFIEGLYHELLGLALFAVGLAIVLAITRSMMRITDTSEFSFTGPPPEPRASATAFATAILFAGFVAGVAALLIPTLNRSSNSSPDFAALPAKLGPWEQLKVEGGDPPIPHNVEGALTFNAGLHRFYTPANVPFEKADVWLLYWKSATVVKDYHHPDVCYALRGDTLVARSLEPVTTPGGRRIDMTYREFSHGESTLQVIYWTQEGRRIWTEKDEATAASFLFPFAWIEERLAAKRAPDECDDRLVIMAGIPLFKNSSASRQKAKLLDFAARLADEVYILCPWADPKGR